MFLRFRPQQSATGAWTAEKMGLPVDMRDVLTGGSKHMHGVGTGFSFKNKDRQLAVDMLDSGIVTTGLPDALPTPVDAAPDFAEGASVVLWDNLWGASPPHSAIYLVV